MFSRCNDEKSLKKENILTIIERIIELAIEKKK